jgi:DNA-binding transcriptional ArsR family regulator
MARGSAVLDTSEQVMAITHPTRLQILNSLRTPDSAAGVARRLGQPRQRVNHHVKELAVAGLLREAGERRRGNFVERLYESIGGTFIVSPRLAWRDVQRLRALSDQLSLANLIDFGERLQRAAASLLDGAAFEGEQIPSAAVEATVRFTDDATRAEFMKEYLELTAQLVERYATRDGPAFAIGFVVHPLVEEHA